MAEGWGQRLREAREAAGWSQAELADRTQLDPSLVSRYELEKVRVSPEAFRKLTTALQALSPVGMLNDMGYPITVPGADRLPRALVQDLLALSPEELNALALLVRRTARPGRPPRDTAAS